MYKRDCFLSYIACSSTTAFPTSTILSVLETRKAAVSDIPSLLSLINSAYRASEGIKGWTYEGHLLEGPRADTLYLEELITTPDSVMLMCFNGKNELCGSVHLSVKEQVLHFGMLAVDPVQQSKGIGTYILNKAKAFGRLSGCQSMKLTVLAGRDELIGWYGRCGFVSTNEQIDFPHTTRFGIPKMPLALVVMACSLAE